MWGFGAKSTTTKAGSASSGSNKKPRASSSSAHGFDLDFPIEDDIHAADLENDASLLAELNSLRSSMGLDTAPSKPVPTSVSKPSKPVPSAAPKTLSAAPSNTNVPPGPAPVDDDGAIDVDGILSSLPIDINAADDEDDIHVELTDADLNDPGLLSELAAVGGLTGDAAGDEQHESNVLSTALPTTKPSVAPTQNASDDVDELSALQASMSISVPSTSNPPAASITSETDSADVPLEHKLKCQDTDLLLKYIQLEKVQAVSKKRAGDKVGALNSMKAMKALEERYSSLMQASSPSEQQNAGSISSSHEPDSASPPIASPQTARSVAVPQQPQATSPNTALVNELKQRQLEYRQASLASKRAGDIPKAKEMLLVSKSIEKALESVETGAGLPDGFTLPSPPSLAPAPTPQVVPQPPSASQPATKPPPTTETTKKQSSPPASRKTVTTSSAAETLDILNSQPSDSLPYLSQPQDVYNHLQSKLEAQRDICTTIAAHHFKAGRKDKALEFHKKKKLIVSDLEALLAMKAAGAAPPAFVYQSVTYEIEQRHDDVGTDEAEVCVVRAFDLGGRASGVPSGEVESYVTFEFGWPTEESGKGAEGKGTSGTVGKDSSPVYNFAKKVPIERTRTFQRHLERRKAVFDVFHVNRGWGGISLFSKPTCLGRAYVKLDALLSKCEIHEVIDLVDPNNPRKSLGGKLEVRIRLRAPLAKPDVVVKQERWILLQLGTPNQPPAQAAAAPPVTLPSTSPVVSTPASIKSVESSTERLVEPTAAQPVQRVDSPKPVQHPPATASPTPSRPATPAAGHASAASSTPKVAASTPAVSSTDDLEELEMQFLNPETIASNQVLEAEYNALVAQIAALKAARKPVPDELDDRKTGYEIRMNLLVTMVQVGALTMQAYIDSVKANVATTKKQTLAFKNAGKMDLTKQGMVRIKLMTDEVTEVEQAIAAGEI
ncbi:Coiled-coil and C2 domain-containing protein 1B [Chytridiales sp. JEL 0842]|nr:Coiled-coil and C2 domain-containing protein 1B [Chytridiales sp. JEL 0842]